MKVVKYLPILGLLYFSTALRAQQPSVAEKVRSTLKQQIEDQAAWALREQPQTITATICTRSEGGVHDFYSEGDYWWPDPQNPQGPFVRRDGQSNPENFVSHRRAMIRFSRIIGALASAYTLKPDPIYLEHAIKHLEAWFVHADTKMNPNLLYAQAIKGLFSGRGIGIIDTIHLIEVAQGMLVFERAEDFPVETKQKVHEWFAEYLDWITSHQYGLDEMKASNNHGTCWVLQVASFAKLVGDKAKLELARERFKTVLLPTQLSSDGSFPLELSRTKPYGYSLFNLDAMVMIAHILSSSEDNLWEFSTDSGASLRTAMEFMYPFMKNKDAWPYQKDVMYWEQWPVAQPALVFCASAYNKDQWIELWAKLDHLPTQGEVIRNLPIRNPVIWF
ncbi:alginate lyase family protein [Sphingobacterium sp. JB170]|uniref:alginate lyase family protein n=1 Tax=Sphingobacterium sp. JB170 TaxID=1434842 RepID=UPI00097F61AD|nr:alginate lyase family protein [Sphingobacterium sp. JB170]SJN46643.1 probable exported protein YPO3473 [Sphingobacterium sp. JB170]